LNSKVVSALAGVAIAAPAMMAAALTAANSRPLTLRFNI
jgi:hypothetical protein